MNQFSIDENEWSATPSGIQNVVQLLVTQVNELSSNVALSKGASERLIDAYTHARSARVAKQAVFISTAFGPRPYKFARYLKKRGWGVILLHEANASIPVDHSFVGTGVYTSKEELLQICLSMNPQVFHVFAHWSFEIPAYLISSGLKPVIFDDYDALSGWVKDPDSTDAPDKKFLLFEQYCLERADGLAVRDLRMQQARREFGLTFPAIRTLCIDGSLTKEDYSILRQPKRTDGIHIVYVGNVTNPASDSPRNFHFELAKVLNDAGIHYHIYFSYERDFAEYAAACRGRGITHGPGTLLQLHNTLPADQLVREISQYHFGLHVVSPSGGRVPGDHAVYQMEMSQYSSANKLFDYMAAGLFSFTLKSKWLHRLIHRTGMGMPVNSFQEIVNEANKRQQNTLPDIPAFLTTEYAVDNLIQMYNQFSS